MKATALKVQIKREEKIMVDLKFPLFTLTVIETFIPEKALSYLHTSSIDLGAILKRVEDSGHVPQSILDFDHEGRHFSIWIE